MWILKWQVQSQSNPSRRWTVAVDERGGWGCSCPQGKYRRDRGPCKHIREVQAGQAKAAKLPSQDPGRAVRTPPVMSAAPAATGARLRNVKDVYAELRDKPAEPREKPQAPNDGAPTHLLAALDD